MVLVVAAGRAAPAENPGGKVDLRALNWVIREPGSGTRRALEDLVAREGLSLEDLNIFLELPGNEAVRAAVEAGAGATIISRHVVASAIAAGRLKEIPIDLPQREYALLRHRDRHAT
ncbi:transcriptional regulator, LysR family, partial [mine drainage metagenome]